MATTIHIKNMVCNRCILVVERLLAELGFTPVHVELGRAVVQEPLSDADMCTLRSRLEAVGFELIDDKRTLLIEQLRNAVIELVHRRDNDLRTNLSDYLSGKFHSDYGALSKLFSEVAGITLEKYYIAQKIERVKELLVYNELSLSEIADKLNYSSVAHLSAQFKSVTGVTPTAFRRLNENRRRPLDQV